MLGIRERGLCLYCVDKEKLQLTVDAAKAAEAKKYDELITANRDQIATLEHDNESLKQVC